MLAWRRRLPHSPQHSLPSPPIHLGQLLHNDMLSDPHVGVALVGVREPRFVELNNEISDDVASWIDLALHDRDVR